MKRAIFLIAVALALARPVAAQVMPVSPQAVTTIDAGVQCSVARSCAQWDIGSAPTVTMQITGTFTGTLTFEARAFTQDIWFAVSVINVATGGLTTTATTTGQFSFLNTGITGFRVRATAAMTGGANVSLTRGTAMSVLKGATPGGALAPSSVTTGGDITTTGTGRFLAQDGTALLPSYAFASQPTLGFWRSSAGNVTLQGALNVVGAINSTGGGDITTQGGIFAGSAQRIRFTNQGGLASPANGVFVMNLNDTTTGVEFKVDSLPVASACGAGSPAVVAGSTAFWGAVTVGTGAPATCTITFGGTAYPAAPHCSGAVETTTAANARTMGYLASATVLTIVPAAAWADGSVVNWSCASKSP